MKDGLYSLNTVVIKYESTSEERPSPASLPSTSPDQRGTGLWEEFKAPVRNPHRVSGRFSSLRYLEKKSIWHAPIEQQMVTVVKIKPL